MRRFILAIYSSLISRISNFWGFRTDATSLRLVVTVKRLAKGMNRFRVICIGHTVNMHAKFRCHLQTSQYNVPILSWSPKLISLKSCAIFVQLYSPVFACKKDKKGQNNYQCLIDKVRFNLKILSKTDRRE